MKSALKCALSGLLEIQPKFSLSTAWGTTEHMCGPLMTVLTLQPYFCHRASKQAPLTNYQASMNPKSEPFSPKSGPSDPVSCLIEFLSGLFAGCCIFFDVKKIHNEFCLKKANVITVFERYTINFYMYTTSQ